MTLKFSSVEEGKKWFEGYRATFPSTTHSSELADSEEWDDGELYEAFDEIQSESHPSSSSGGMSKSVSFVSSVGRSDSRVSFPEGSSAASIPEGEGSAASLDVDSRGSGDKMETASISSGIKVCIVSLLCLVLFKLCYLLKFLWY